MELNFREASLRPPVHGNKLPDDAPSPGSCVMIDVRAYIADRRNATTACGRMSNHGKIQVTFCFAPPPAVSYFCIWCPETSYLSDLGTEPRIVAAEADLVILRVGLGGSKRPSLHLIETDDPFCLFFSVGILRHRNGDDDRYFIVSLLCSDLAWKFNMNIYDSNIGIWRSKLVSVKGRAHQHSQFCHSSSKVIMLGEGGFMGFVDLWRGILVCNVLDPAALHYLPFPRTLRNNKKLRHNPMMARDIVVAQGRIKVVDCFYCSASSAWKASVWSRDASSLVDDEDNWKRDYYFQIRNNLVDNNTMNFELLPKLQAGDDLLASGASSPKELLGALHIACPTLSLDSDGDVYFMAKFNPQDNRACVLAVDLKNKRIKDVGVFCTDRPLSYIHSRVSKYFHASPGGSSWKGNSFMYRGIALLV